MLISFHLPCSARALTPADESLGPPDTWLSVRFRQGEAAAKDERVAGERDWGISSPLPPWFSNPILICIFGRRVFPKTESPARQPHFHLSSSSWAHWLFSPSLTASDPGGTDLLLCGIFCTPASLPYLLTSLPAALWEVASLQWLDSNPMSRMLFLAGTQTLTRIYY